MARRVVQCVEPESGGVYAVAVYGGVVADHAAVADGRLRRMDDADAVCLVCAGGIDAVDSGRQPPFPAVRALDRPRVRRGIGLAGRQSNQRQLRFTEIL